MSELFRREAVEHHRQRLYGEVVMTLPLTHWAITTVIALAIILLLSFLVFGSYARKETIGGWVRPDHGIVRVQTQDEGVVEAISVVEGQDVEAGASLLALRLDADLRKGESFSRRLTADFENERHQLQDQMSAAQAQFRVREARVRGEVAGLERELDQYRRQLKVLDARTVLAKRQLDQRTALVRQGFVSRLDAEKLEDTLLATHQATEDLTQDILVKENKAKALRHDLTALPHERQAALAVLGERVATLDQRATEAGRRSHIVLTAPVAGRVADVRVELGETAKAKSVLIEILPQGAQIQVELFAPSRATGFLIAGSEVQLRYDAFPYQKFGVSKGRVLRISRSTMDARDLPRSISVDEPVYRVIVALDRQNVLVNGKEHPLQSGMTLKADLILERRRMIEYLFAPLLGAVRRG